MTTLTVLDAAAVRRVVSDRHLVLEAVRAAYLAFSAETTSNPHSHFLRFADQPSSRIIALPARMRTDGRDVAGIKWVASFPGNHEVGLPRASAVVVLNDMATGRPIALLEASQINIARTAASAALVLSALVGESAPLRSVGLVGGGPVGQEIVSYIAAAGHELDRLVIHDLREELSAQAARTLAPTARVAVTGTLADVLACDVVVTATTATAPYVDTPPRPGQVYLNISLRDFHPAALRDAANIVDDVEHCVRERTSPHLTALELGHTDFIATTIPRLLGGEMVDLDRGVVVSPFGLGVLDLAVAAAVLASTDHPSAVVRNFYGDAPCVIA